MAIKNLLKTGTYSRISSIIYETGQVSKVEMKCYDSTPTKSFLELRTPTVVAAVDADSEDLETETLETVETIHIFNFYADDLETLEISAGASMHNQIYTHLLTKSLFAGCISDE